MPIERLELEIQLVRLAAVLAAKTAEMNQIDGAKAFCEHLLSVCDEPPIVPIVPEVKSNEVQTP